jgi:dihydroorotase
MKNRIFKPFDWHLHLRADKRTEIVTPFSVEFTSAATIMPNVIFPKTGKSLMTTEGVLWYRGYLEQFLKSSQFTPIMTFYVGQDTNHKDIRQGYLDGVFKAGKLYPLNATTGSHDGLSKIEDGYLIFAVMEELGIPLLIHPEMSPDPDAIDVLDSEAIFVKTYLIKIRRDFPNLKIVVEHITCIESMNFVITHDNTWGTIAPQHLLYNHNHLFHNGLQVNLHCFPTPKSIKHQKYLLKQFRFMVQKGKLALGTDSAPHMRETKECACSCAGAFTSPTMWELYYLAVQKAEPSLTHNEIMSLLQKFTHNLLDVYGIDLEDISEERYIRIEHEEWVVPSEYGGIVPLVAGQTLPIKAYFDCK